MRNPRHRHPWRTGRWLVWGWFALALVLAPLVFPSGFALAMLSQMGYLVIICLSYNILLGQGGMLSFGHAIYTGFGGVTAIHAMNLAAAGTVVAPLIAVPLIGGLAGAAAALVLGYVSTKKAGTAFAMITLGLGELVAALAPLFPGVFGGEAGLTSNRVYGTPSLGFTFGPALHMYYLIAGYCFACTALMFAFTGTPLGRMLNAVRDNPERVQFIGYNPQRVRWFSYTVSGFFAGLGGALAAINLEIFSASDAFSSLRSGSYLLFTFLGGAGFFFGPIIGAMLLVLASVWLSQLTQAWLLYVGLGFLLMVLVAPGGVASLIMASLRGAYRGTLVLLWRPCAVLLVSGALAVVSVACVVEMVYHVQLNASRGPLLRFANLQLNTANPACWLAASGLMVLALGGLQLARRRFAAAWGKAQETVEIAIEPSRLEPRA